jgi:ATP-dependent exoDNAse (exonuclease V) alpha subunit
MSKTTNMVIDDLNNQYKGLQKALDTFVKDQAELYKTLNDSVDIIIETTEAYQRIEETNLALKKTLDKFNKYKK